MGFHGITLPGGYWWVLEPTPAGGKPVANITVGFVKKLTPDPTRAVYHFDDRLTGFGVKVTPQGKKTYFAQYREGRGREARKVRETIGAHGAPWTADTARDEAKRILGKAANGVSVVAEKRAERQAITMAELCRAYLEAAEAGTLLVRNGKAKKPSTLATDNGRIARHILPLLGHYKVKSVDRAAVAQFVSQVTVGKTAATIERSADNGIQVHGKVNVTGGAGTAARTVGLLGGIMTYAMEQGIIEGNPVDRVKRPAAVRRERTLTPEEFKRLGDSIRTLETQGRNKGQLNAVRLAALTAMRKSEVFGLQWSEVDLEGRVIRLDDSKTGKSLRPLGKAALELLRSRAVSKSDPVYVLRGKGGRQLTGSKVVSEAFDLAGLDDCTLHTLRHSFGTLADELGYSEATVGVMLGHSRHTTTAGYIHRKIDGPTLAAADAVSVKIATMLDGTAERSGAVINLRTSAA
jgi:integrase